MKNKINCNTIFASEDIILEKKTNVITSLLLLIISAVMTSIIWHYISNNIIFLFFFSLYWLLCLVSTIKTFLYESYFVINERGFCYGKQKRFSKKAIVKDIDYNWHQIKEIYFETTTTLHTSIYLIVVKKNGVKNTIGLSLLPISKKELKFLIIKYSKRNDIFRN